MQQKKTIGFLILFILFFSSNLVVANGISGLVKVVSIEGTFQDVKERVIFAVESQGLVVDHTSDVGGMLARTGKDLGETTQIYQNAQVLEFCSALYSRKMVKFSPALLAYCPYAISVYTLNEDPATTYVAFKRISRGIEDIPTRNVLKEIDDLLEAIIEEAAL